MKTKFKKKINSQAQNQSFSEIQHEAQNHQRCLTIIYVIHTFTCNFYSQEMPDNENQSKRQQKNV